MDDLRTDHPGDYFLDHFVEDEKEVEIKVASRVMYKDEEFIWHDCPMWDCFSCLTFSHEKKINQLIANDDQAKSMDNLIQEFLVKKAKEIRDTAKMRKESPVKIAQDHEKAARDLVDLEKAARD